MNNPIDKGLEETIESELTRFDKELGNKFNFGDWMNNNGISPGMVKQFLKSSLTLAYTRGRESVKNLKKK